MLVYPARSPSVLSAGLPCSPTINFITVGLPCTLTIRNLTTVAHRPMAHRLLAHRSLAYQRFLFTDHCLTAIPSSLTDSIVLTRLCWPIAVLGHQLCVAVQSLTLHPLPTAGSLRSLAIPTHHACSPSTRGHCVVSLVAAHDGNGHSLTGSPTCLVTLSYHATTSETQRTFREA